MREVGCNNTIAMFFLQVFGHFDFLLQVLGQEADPAGSVWVRYLKPWNWDGKQAWKWERCSILLDGIPSSSSRCPQEHGRCPAP